ncbi:MAG TPA: DUF402 domain-containing protein [Nocardioides sp.]|uniref:DUF402 domain-containing protein n=1 Tax=Nocardioides sp. TaxID=35761 RepID=UPI002F417C65
MGFELGDPIRIEMTKWVDLPHWHIPGRWLGSDDHGDWIGIPAGSRMVRPGADVLSAFDQVGLVPAPGTDVERAFLATFHADGAPTQVYVDMATPPVWNASTIRTVDLDLDVLRRLDGSVVVDDEDEFAEHQVELGYPAEIVALAEASRDRVHAAILAGDPPYDGSHRRWQRVLDDLR